MRRFIITTVCASVVTVMLMGSAGLAAEHQMAGQMPMGCQAGQPEQAGGQRPMMGRGMMGQGGMGMMCSMMGCQMDPSGMGMMGMMGGGKMEPKAMGRMLEMRGEMMKAVGEVLQKHGRSLAEEAK